MHSPQKREWLSAVSSPVKFDLSLWLALSENQPVKKVLYTKCTCGLKTEYETKEFRRSILSEGPVIDPQWYINLCN